MTRTIKLMEDLDKKLADSICEKILKYNEYDDGKEDQDRDEINLIIDSRGGDAEQALRVINYIHLSKNPVYTYNYGSAMSSAFCVFLAGHKRFTSKYSKFHTHPSSITLDSAPIPFAKHYIEDCLKTESLIDSLLFDKTKLSKEELENLFKKYRDVYFLPEHAMELGIATDWFDKII